MATAKNNLLLQGLSGMLGRQLVVRQTAHGTVVTVAPSCPTGPSTPGQEAQRSRFQLAVAYAKAYREAPDVLARCAALAAARGLKVYNLLIQEFMYAPRINALDASAYLGQPGQPIHLTLPAHFALASVEVQLILPNGTLLEQGPAQLQADASQWHYLATVPNPNLPGTMLAATTHTGHRATLTQLLG
jgi:hypothetical protein